MAITKLFTNLTNGVGLCLLASSSHMSHHNSSSEIETIMISINAENLFLKVKVLVAQSCSTLCVTMDCSPPGSSVHGILQARLVEWVAMPFSRGSSQTRDGEGKSFRNSYEGSYN